MQFLSSTANRNDINGICIFYWWCIWDDSEMLREYNSLLIISKLYIALGHLIISKKLPGLIVVADHVKQFNIHS